jgi:hypothetical protein
MKLDNVIGRRRKPRASAEMARHRRKCNICNHIDRAAIEEDFLRWRSPEEIIRDYNLGHRSALYRHADATGLSAKRRENCRTALDILIEQVESAPVTAAVIIRAIRAYSCLTDDGRWVEPPKRTIVLRREESPAAPSTEPAAAAQDAASLIATNLLENPPTP